MVRNLEQDIREFLFTKPGHLKSGVKKIASILNTNDLDTVRRVKKEMYKASRYGSKTDVAQEYARQVKKNVQLMEDASEAERIKAMIRPKKQRAKFHTPKVSDQEGMHILLGCNHVPFHNVALHNGIIQMIKDHKKSIRGFHLMGDFLDLNPLSSHDKGKFTAVPGLTLDDEYQIGSDLLYDFEAVLPKNTWKTYLYGNHEDRYNRWMASTDNSKTPLISPVDGLRLIQRGFNVKTNWSQDFITLGNDFDIFHGIYFSVHNAKAHLDKLRRSCAYVHTHRIQNYREGVMAAFNIGSCANFLSKAFNYATRPMKAQWANGFAVNYIDEFGRSNVTQITANPDGSFYFGGKKY